jgi:hypothetical protein
MASFKEEEQLGSMSAQKTLQFLNCSWLPKPPAVPSEDFHFF